MKHIRRIIALVLCTALACLSLSALAEDGITVNGKGETYISADTVYVTLGVQISHENVREAQNTVNEKIKAIREALIAMGIPKEDINTDQLNIYMYTEYTDGTERNVYHVSSMMTVRSEDITAAGNIIDTAFAEGANTLNGVQFAANDTTEAENEAIRLAVADARRKAEVIAEAAGLKITGIEHVSEGCVSSYDSGINNYGVMYESPKEEDVAATEVQAAKLCITAQVTIAYETTNDD